MTLEQFKCLNNEDQEFILKFQSVFIASMENERGTHALFQVDSFYLEVFYTNHNYIVRTINYFDETDLLEPYLDLIDISSIYKMLGYGKIQ